MRCIKANQKALPPSASPMTPKHPLANNKMCTISLYRSARFQFGVSYFFDVMFTSRDSRSTLCAFILEPTYNHIQVWLARTHICSRPHRAPKLTFGAQAQISKLNENKRFARSNRSGWTFVCTCVVPIYECADARTNLVKSSPNIEMICLFWKLRSVLRARSILLASHFYAYECILFMYLMFADYMSFLLSFSYSLIRNIVENIHQFNQTFINSTHHSMLFDIYSV